MSRELVIVHEPGRLVARVGGEAAFLAYEQRGDILDVQHTYTPPALRSRSLAAALTRAALDYAAARGLKVVPTCPYTRSYFARHPEVQGLRAPGV